MYPSRRVFGSLDYSYFTAFGVNVVENFQRISLGLWGPFPKRVPLFYSDLQGTFAHVLHCFADCRRPG